MTEAALNLVILDGGESGLGGELEGAEATREASARQQLNKSQEGQPANNETAWSARKRAPNLNLPNGASLWMREKRATCDVIMCSFNNLGIREYYNFFKHS